MPGKWGPRDGWEGEDNLTFSIVLITRQLGGLTKDNVQPDTKRHIIFYTFVWPIQDR